MMKYYTAALALALVAFSLSIAPAQQVGQPAPTFNLADQFGKNWSLANLKGTVTVLVVADRDSGRSMGPWVDNLKTKYGSRIQVLGLLDLHTVPGIGRGIARSRVRSETKDPLMLDFNGGTGKAYSVSNKYPVVVVIDKTSQVRAVEKTNYTDDAFKSITTAVDAALKD